MVLLENRTGMNMRNTQKLKCPVCGHSRLCHTKKCHLQLAGKELSKMTVGELYIKCPRCQSNIGLTIK